MIEISIAIKNDEDKPEGFVLVVDPVMLGVYQQLHDKPPFEHIIETLNMCFDPDKNDLAKKMKSLVEAAVDAIPKEEIAKQIAEVTKGE